MGKHYLLFDQKPYLFKAF